jgi:segregation and condensation protein A
MAIHIQLKQFDGPLDLLLHLIGKAKIDIKDIFVSGDHGAVHRGGGERAGLRYGRSQRVYHHGGVLVEIKSRSLLPRSPAEDEEDPSSCSSTA